MFLSGQPRPTTVYHVGGRGGIHRSFGTWPLPLRYVTFEPDGAEAARLRLLAGDAFEVEEVAVGAQTGRRPFNLYSLITNPGAAPSGELSSLLQLAPSRPHRYRDADISLAAKVDIDLDTIDNVAARRQESPTFLVADIQGAEIMALEGARTTLRQSVLGVRLEVAFMPLYEDQPLFGDVDAMMRACGFELSRIERCGSPTFGPSTDAGPFSASLEDARPAWADAMYVRSVPPHTADGRWRGIDLANLLYYTLANGVGSVGLDLLFEALEQGYLADSLDELDPTVAAAVGRHALEHLERAERAAVTASDPTRAARDAERRTLLKSALRTTD